MLSKIFLLYLINYKSSKYNKTAYTRLLYINQIFNENLHIYKNAIKLYIFDKNIFIQHLKLY